MFIAKNNALIILAKETREELEKALQLMTYTSIEETEIEYRLYNGSYLTKEEIVKQERKHINTLSLTAADVERAIYKDKGLDFDDILKLVEEQGTGIDLKALKIEFKANNFYRGNQYVVAIGSLLGYSSEELDFLFQNKEFPKKENEEV